MAAIKAKKNDTRADTLRRLLPLIGMTEAEHAAFRYEQGCLYLERVCPPVLAYVWQRRWEFWHWWDGHWFLFDRDFLALEEEGVAHLATYRYLRDVKYLAETAELKTAFQHFRTQHNVFKEMK